MNILKNNLNICGDYFKGFQDVKEHKSATKVGLGVLKVVSYATLLVPIIFGVGYLINKSLLSGLSLCMFVPRICLSACILGTNNFPLPGEGRECNRTQVTY